MKINNIKLITLQAQKGMKNKDLTLRAGVGHATISNIRNGKSCKYETACKIAKALNVSVEELIEQ